MILWPDSVEMRGNQYLRRLTKRFAFPRKVTSRRRTCRQGAAEPGRRRYVHQRTSCITQLRYFALLREAPATRRSDVMNLEGLILPAMALAVATALTGSDVHAQTPQDCGGRNVAAAGVARVIDGRSFLLADGREVRLAAIETPLAVAGDEDEARVQAALAAKTALEALLLHREINLFVLGSGPDRYGRLVAYAFIRTPS